MHENRRLLTRQEVRDGLVPPYSFIVCPVEDCPFELLLPGQDPEAMRVPMTDHMFYLHVDDDAGAALRRLRVETPVTEEVAYVVA